MYDFDEIAILQAIFTIIAVTLKRHQVLGLSLNMCTNKMPFGISYYRSAYNTQGDVTSQNLWPRYDCHFVGITWHTVWS